MTMKIKGTEGIEFPDATVQASAAFTKAQTNSRTWQDLTSSRAIASTYTNNTGRPIEVSIMVQGPNGAAGAGGIEGYCQGQKVADFSTTASNGTSWNGLAATMNFTVPDGAAYQLLNRLVPNVLVGWKELR